jgi:hypothetical protein
MVSAGFRAALSRIIALESTLLYRRSFMRNVTVVIFFWLIYLGGGSVWADSSTTNPSATQPATTQSATTQRAIHIAVIPPGFHSITVADRTVFCLPSDDDWVRDALGGLQPATRPTTLPSDLITNIQQRRDEITKQAMAELGLTDPKPLNELFDLKLAPLLKDLLAIKPTVYYLVASRPQLIKLLKDGWSDPRYRYLRFANDVAYSFDVNLAIDAKTDDSVMWAELHDDAPQNRGKALLHTVTDFDGGFLNTLSMLSQLGTRNEFDELIRTEVTDPLKLPPGLQWFGRAIDMIYAIKYESMLTGASRRDQVANLVGGNPRNPLHSQPLNLLEPIDPASMKPDYVGLYNEALIHKGAGVVAAWIAKGGDGVLAKALPAFRANPPATAADLVKIIQQSTGIDITPALAPNFKDTPPQL